MKNQFSNFDLKLSPEKRLDEDSFFLKVADLSVPCIPRYEHKKKYSFSHRLYLKILSIYI
jgi:hypothetical protein